MSADFKANKVSPKIGDEPFHNAGSPLGPTLLEFWRWYSSDLLSNALRGIIAEYLVAYALGVTNNIRIEWSAYDLKTSEGLKIEVKSAAYLQSWHQTKLSTIQFNIGATLGWDPETNLYEDEKRRQADVYVFCVLDYQDKLTVDPLDVNQWVFYVLPTTVLNEKLSPTQMVIGLSSLLKLQPRIARYEQLRDVINEVGTTLKNTKQL